MKFIRTELIGKITDILNVDGKNQKVREKAQAESVKRHQEKWIREELPKWREFRDEITAAVKKGEPITSEKYDFFGRYGNRRDNGGVIPHYYATPYARDDKDLVEIQKQHPTLHESTANEFRAIKAALECIQDDEISDAQLGRLGFGASSISRIFTAATNLVR